MIDKKKIEEAANLHLEEVRDIYRDEVFGVSYPTESKDIEGQIMDDFTDGANWAIGEFKKSLWHDASKNKPIRGKSCIVEIVYQRPCGLPDKMEYVTSDFSQYGWNEYHFRYSRYNITRWCYIDDLLPKKGGKK